MIGAGPGSPPAGVVAASSPSRLGPFISATDPADLIRGGAFQVQGTAFTQEGRTVTGATVDGEDATPTAPTNTTIEAVCPAFESYPHSGDVAVAFSDGAGAALGVDVVLPPIDTSVMDPVAPPATQAFVITLTGSGFDAAGFAPYTVTIAGIVNVIDSFTATEIVATFPSGIATAGVKAVSVQFEAGPDASAPDVTIAAPPAPTWANIVPAVDSGGNTYTGTVNGNNFLAGRTVTSARLQGGISIAVTTGPTTDDSIGLVAQESFPVFAPSLYRLHVTFSDLGEVDTGLDVDVSV